MKKVEYNVSGMTCQGCASSVSRVLLRNKAVDDVVIDHMKGQVVVTFDEKQLDDDTIISQISKLGFTAEVKA